MISAQKDFIDGGIGHEVLKVILEACIVNPYYQVKRRNFRENHRLFKVLICKALKSPFLLWFSGHFLAYYGTFDLLKMFCPLSITLRSSFCWCVWKMDKILHSGCSRPQNAPCRPHTG